MGSNDFGRLVRWTLCTILALKGAFGSTYILSDGRFIQQMPKMKSFLTNRSQGPINFPLLDDAEKEEEEEENAQKTVELRAQPIGSSNALAILQRIRSSQSFEPRRSFLLEDDAQLFYGILRQNQPQQHQILAASQPPTSSTQADVLDMIRSTAKAAASTNSPDAFSTNSDDGVGRRRRQEEEEEEYAAVRKLKEKLEAWRSFKLQLRNRAVVIG